MNKYDDQKPPPKTPKPNIPPKGREKKLNPCSCGNENIKLGYNGALKYWYCPECGKSTIPTFKKITHETWNKLNKQSNQITEAEQENILKNILKQKIQISKQITLRTFNKIKIKCYDCGEDTKMIFMYKCFQCHLYICQNCAPTHFNIDKSKLPKYIKEKK